MMKEPTYKAFLAESDTFRQSLAGYIGSRNYVDEHKELSYRIIDAINRKSKTDTVLRAEAYKYFTCQPGYSTIKLRDICKTAGFDYWAGKNTDLSISNAIDTIDTAHLYFGSEKAMQSFSLQKLSVYREKDGNIILSSDYRGLTALEFIDNHLKTAGYDPAMTQLYRVSFRDSGICTTWQHADLDPVSADILAIELDFRYVAILADPGAGTMPVALDMRNGEIVVAPVYEDYDWIRKASCGQLQAVCDAVAARFEDSRAEMSVLKPKDK